MALFASMTEHSGGSTSFLRSLPLQAGDLASRSYDHFDTRQQWSNGDNFSQIQLVLGR